MTNEIENQEKEFLINDLRKKRLRLNEIIEQQEKSLKKILNERDNVERLRKKGNFYCELMFTFAVINAVLCFCNAVGG